MKLKLFLPIFFVLSYLLSFAVRAQESFLNLGAACDTSTIPSSCESSGRPMCACCPVVNGEGGGQWACMGTIDEDSCAGRAPPNGGKCYIQNRKGKPWYEAEKD